jgi:hypothetical protein
MNLPQAQLTTRQIQVFVFIEEFRLTNAGRSTLFQRIADELGIASASTAFKQVRALEGLCCRSRCELRRTIAQVRPRGVRAKDPIPRAEKLPQQRTGQSAVAPQ